MIVLVKCLSIEKQRIASSLLSKLTGEKAESYGSAWDHETCLQRSTASRINNNLVFKLELQLKLKLKVSRIDLSRWLSVHAAMNRKLGEKRTSLSSEVRNASMVKNKCEELKLERKRRSLDKLRAYENLAFVNKKKELIDLQLSIQSSKTDVSGRQGNNPYLISSARLKKEDNNLLNVCSSQGMFRSRGKSWSGSDIVLPLFDTIDKTKLLRHASHSTSTLGSLSRSRGDCQRSDFRRFSTGKRLHENEATKKTSDSIAQAGETTPCGQNVSKLFPPFYLQPLHKQKSKSLKDLSLVHLEKQRNLGGNKEVSWYDLSNCRYLRGWKTPTSEFLQLSYNCSCVRHFKINDTYEQWITCV